MGERESIARFQNALRGSKKIIVVSGAGLSAASGTYVRLHLLRRLPVTINLNITGIPTFRGAGGMWRTLDAMSLATPKAFSRNPSLVWQFYHYRRETCAIFSVTLQGIY